MEEYYLQFAKCAQHEAPPCTLECPFGVDILEFLNKIRSGRVPAAYKKFRDATGFPEIVSKLCPGYCMDTCVRKGCDVPVQVNLIEQSCLALTDNKKPNEYNLPIRKGKIAIIGAGISGLGCLLRLSAQKYDVTVYEREKRIGGRLTQHPLYEEFYRDVMNQLQFEKYVLKLNSEIGEITDEMLTSYQAIYIAAGEKDTTFCFKQNEFVLSRTAIVLGGSMLGMDIMHALADGLNAAKTIDAYLKTGILKRREKVRDKKIVIDTKHLKPVEAVLPDQGNLYSQESMLKEAKRCIRCQCNQCRTYCDLTDYYGKWPLEMRDDIMTTVKASESLVHKTAAMHLINACTQCGMCKDICPEGIELGDMIRLARKSSMRREKHQ